MELQAVNKDVDSSKSTSDFNQLFVKMLEDKKRDGNKDAKETRIKNINRYIKSTENYRTLGLISLSEFLELHSVVSSSFTTEKECQELEWIEIILRMIDHKSEEPSKCFVILTKLIKITAQHLDMHKIIQGKYVSKIIESITSNPLTISSLKCLIACLKEYNGPCGIFKNKIYSYCIASIDTVDSSLNGLSAKCLHLLQQTKGGSIAGSAYKKNWAEYHQKLLNTLEELFINLLQTGQSVNTGKSERLKLPEEAEHKKNMPQIYSQQERFTRFQNICIFLNISLLQPFPAPKSILLDWIISFLDKSITINQTQINKKDGNRILPFVLNIEIQKCLLNILQSVIKCVGRNIMVHSKDVCDIFWRSLKSTNVPYDEFKVKDVTSLRCTIYDVIADFMKISPNNHFIYKNMENFMKEAFVDITPIQAEILLTLPNQALKKKKKKDPQVKRQLSGKTFDNCIKLHQELCIKSLNLLNNLLVCNGAGIKPVLFKILTDKILIVTFRFLSRDLTQQELYHSSACRLMILDVIYNLLINPAVRNATPSSFMIELLRKFKDGDKNDNVRHKASEMLRNVEAILHSRKDPIHFPPDLKDFRDTWLFNEKTVKAFADIDKEVKEQAKIIEINASDDDLVINIADGESDSEESVVETNGIENSQESDDEMEITVIPNEIAIEEEKVEKSADEEQIKRPAAVTKRASTAKNNDKVPIKMSKTSEKEAEKVNNNAQQSEDNDDVLDAYMADFCGE